MPGVQREQDVREWDPEPMAAVLMELASGQGYVRAEYVARLLLLARGVAQCRALRTLDMGCGYGALSLALAETQGVYVTAFDIQRGKVTAVRSTQRARPYPDMARLNLLVADAEGGLPFKEGAFDAAILTEVLEHVESPSRLLRETSRVLRVGGRLFLTTPHTGALPYRLLRRLPKALVRRLAETLTSQHLHPDILDLTPSHPDHHRHEGFTLDELEGMAREYSLNLVKGFTYRIPLPDKVMRFIPPALAQSLAETGAKPFPLGLEVYCEFVRGTKA